MDGRTTLVPHLGLGSHAPAGRVAWKKNGVGPARGVSVDAGEWPTRAFLTFAHLLSRYHRDRVIHHPRVSRTPVFRSMMPSSPWVPSPLGAWNPLLDHGPNRSKLR